MNIKFVKNKKLNKFIHKLLMNVNKSRSSALNLFILYISYN